VQVVLNVVLAWSLWRDGDRASAGAPTKAGPLSAAGGAGGGGDAKPAVATGPIKLPPLGKEGWEGSFVGLGSWW
jgi:hypothetical protein